MNESKLWEIVEAWEACFAVVHGVAKGQIWLKTELLQELSCKAFIVSCLWIISKLFLLFFFFFVVDLWANSTTGDISSQAYEVLSAFKSFGWELVGIQLCSPGNRLWAHSLSISSLFGKWSQDTLMGRERREVILWTAEYRVWYQIDHHWASVLAQWQIIHLPMQETWVQSLGWEDPLEKGMATHCSVLAWRIPWTEEEPGGLQSMGLQKSQTQLSG